MNNFRRRLSGALLTLAFVFGISAAMSNTTQAQYRNRNDNNREWRNRNRNDRYDNQRGRDSRWRRDRDSDRGDRNRRYRTNDSYRTNGGYGNYGGYNNSSQYEVNRGYQQGLNTGASDAQRGQSYSPQRSRYYKNPSSLAFRQGFVQGYNQGYRQYAGYGNQRNRYPNSGGGLGSIFGRR